MRSITSILVGTLVLLGGVGLAQSNAPEQAPQTQAETARVAPPSAANDFVKQELTKSDLDAWLDGYMPYALKVGDIPGAVVVVVKDGQTLSSRGYGYADLEKRKPVIAERTLFRPGSVSKLITWTAVMQMVEQGKIDLDRDVNNYLDFKIPERNGQPVTTRQLMTHSAGFEDRTKYIFNSDPKKLQPLGEYLKQWVPKRIFDAGTTPAYSNWGTTLAGYIVERVSGKTFDDYVDQNIFAPLDMKDSTFRQPLPDHLKNNMATGYTRTSGDIIEFENVIPAPAGALSSTGADMGRFMLAHLQGGELNGNRILSAETTALMHNSPLTIIPPLNRMQLGFFETDRNGMKILGHMGDTIAFHTTMHLFMNEKVGLYVSFNALGKEGAAATLRGAMFEDFADRYFPADVTDGEVGKKTAVQHATMIAGNWVNTRRAETNFLAVLGFAAPTKILVGSDGQLITPAYLRKDGTPRQWVEIEPFIWRDKDSQHRIAAIVQNDQVVRWGMDYFSPGRVFERAPAGSSATWMTPMLTVGMIIFALTFLLWPVAALVRRKYQAPFNVIGRARGAYRATRVFAGLILAVTIGWIATVSFLFGDFDNLDDSSDWILWLLQIGGLLVFVGAVLVTGWNAWLTWTDGRNWKSKFWNTLLFLASLFMLYFAYTFQLLAMNVEY